MKTLPVDLVDSYQVFRTYTGSIVPRRTSSLGFERSGKLLNLTVDLGDPVEAGAPLAFLDTQQIKARQQEILAERSQANAQLQELLAGARPEMIIAAQSAVDSVHSQLALAQNKSQRRQDLYTSGAISREQLDEAIAEANTLQSRLNEAQSRLNELRTGTRTEQIDAQRALLQRLEARLFSLDIEQAQSILKAPFAGRIANRLVDEGTVVSGGQPILTLVEDQDLEVHIGVPVNTVSQLPLGSTQELQIDSKPYQAQVLSTLPQVDAATHTLTIILSLDQLAAKEVRAGQMVRLNLTETIANDGYWLPTTALERGVRGLWSCYVLETSEMAPPDSPQAYRVEPREIEVLHTQGDRVFVRGALQNSDQVIVSGAHRLVTGQWVRPMETILPGRP